MLAADTTYSGTVSSGLSAQTDYDVWLVAADDEPTPNVLAVPTKVAVSTGADNIPPHFADGYPVISSVADFRVTLAAAADEACDMYWVVLPENAAPAPSTAQVKAGQDGAGNSAVASGNSGIPSAGVVVTSAIDSNLDSSSVYQVWVVLQDKASPPNPQLHPLQVNATTLVDATPPVWQSSFPRAGTQRDISFDIEISISEPGQVYYVVLLDGKSSPSVAEVLGGADGNGVAGVISGSINASSALTTVSTTIGPTAGLVADTGYDVWCVAADRFGNLQVSASRVDIETGADVTAPEFVPGYPTPVAVEDFEFSIASQLNEPGTWYWVALPSGATKPSIANVKNRLDALGSPALAGDSGSIGTAGSTVTARVHGTGLLAAETVYDIWALAEDDEPVPNGQVTLTYTNVTTLPDATPPLFHTAPVVSAVTDFSVTISAALDEPGRFYYVSSVNCVGRSSYLRHRFSMLCAGV